MDGISLRTPLARCGAAQKVPTTASAVICVGAGIRKRTA
jgi:hypothetical protein